MPESRVKLPLMRRFSLEEYEQLSRGHVPEEMEDKWFIYLENDWLSFHRSWTGFCIYTVHLCASDENYVVDEAWVNREPTQHLSTDTATDTDFLSQFLIDVVLLRQHFAFDPKQMLWRLRAARTPAEGT